MKQSQQKLFVQSLTKPAHQIVKNTTNQYQNTLILPKTDF